jgi:hypothetical protein
MSNLKINLYKKYPSGEQFNTSSARRDENKKAEK